MRGAVWIVAFGVAVGAAPGLSSRAAAQWYNGDPDNLNGLPAEFNTEVSDAFVFENFNHGGGFVTMLFGNFYISTDVRGCMYELRSGVSNGFGGTLLAGGDVGGRWWMHRNGFDGHGYRGYEILVGIPHIRLAAGEYMMAISPIGDGTGRAFVQTTSGENSFGTPVNDHRNWYRSGYFGTHYAEDYLMVPGFSYGVGFPAPPSVAVLVLAGVGVRRRR